MARMVPTPRQQREIDYHRKRAQELRHKAEEPVTLDVVTRDQRRWWNAYWHTYTILRELDLRGKRAAVIGCGFGEDAIRIASLGAEVFASDISSESIEIATARARNCDQQVTFDVMPAEELGYPDDFFDLVFFVDILHHVDIGVASNELGRVTKRGGQAVGNELYTHSFLERGIRQSWPVRKVIYPTMVRFIYGTGKPYITEDEHKVNENEFDLFRSHFAELEETYFNIAVGRIFPDRFPDAVAKADRTVARTLGRSARVLAGRVVFRGTIA